MDYTLSGHFDENTLLRDTRLSNKASILSSICCRPRSQAKELDSGHFLPVVLQLTLGLLGLWSPSMSRRMTTARLSKTGLEREQTVVIALPNDSDLSNQRETWSDDSSLETLDEHKNECVNHDGDDEEEEKSLDEEKKSCLTSDVIAIMYLLLSCSLMTYDFQRYMRYYWGKKSDILHLVSYFTFLFQVMVIPFWCFYARILYITLGQRYRQEYPLFRGFLSTRVAVLSSSRFGARGMSWFRLICFLAWPIMNAMLRFANDYYFKSCPGLAVYKEITHWSALLGYIFYGCFCYLIHIERISFECEVRQISVFARDQARVKNVDAVRCRISKFYAHYNVLRRLIRCWMAFTMVVATWGLTAHLTWNYLIFSNTSMDPQNIPVLHFLNVLVSTQKIMFFVVPCVAIGGLNLEHVWKRFKYEIARSQRYTHEAYWRAINKYLYEINVDHSGDLTPTLIFSAIGFYLGLNLGKGDQEYIRWNYPIMVDCNFTLEPNRTTV